MISDIAEQDGKRNSPGDPLRGETDEAGFPHWNLVYLAVVIFTIMKIVALWLFTKAYEP